MSCFAQRFIFVHALLCTSSAFAQGLTGMPGGLAIDPKARAFETEFLAQINARRTQANVEPLKLDERTQPFVRVQAEKTAKGEATDASIIQAIKSGGMAPYGYRLQLGFATDVTRAINDLAKVPGMEKSLVGDFARASVGAFYVPDKKPYFQYVMLLITDIDPMAGKPGLSAAETDKVMDAAMPAMRDCYNQALTKNPNLKGDLILQMIIGGEGRVESQKVLRSVNEPMFEGCTLGVAQGLQFPKPYKGRPVTLNHPMRFTPPQGDKKVGKLDTAMRQAGFGGIAARLKACYDAAAKTKPGISGALTLGLTVAADGSVSALDVVHDELKDNDLATCVMSEVKQIRFARPQFDAPVEFTYPLHFSPISQ